VDIIKTDLTELGWGNMGWIYLAQDRDQHGHDLLGSIICWEVLEQLNDWWLHKKGSAP
jgi:hypothetical protein